MGAIPATVLGMAEHVRGNHPLNSFTAVGPLAHRLIDGQQPLNVYYPLAALTELGGWIVRRGTGACRSGDSGESQHHTLWTR